jgi:hypothetical protein
MNRVRAAVCLAVGALVGAACSASHDEARPARSTTTASERPATLDDVLRIAAPGTSRSYERVSGLVDDLSPALEYFSMQRLHSMAYEDVGGASVPQSLAHRDGATQLCSFGTTTGKARCASYSRPRYASNGRLRSFDLDGVDVTRTVPPYSADDVGKSVVLEPGVTLEFLGYAEAPSGDLQAAFSITNKSQRGFSADPISIQYRAAGKTETVEAGPHARPREVRPDLNGVLFLVFPKQNFGGTVVAKHKGATYEFQVEGAPVPAFRPPSTGAA